MTPRRSTRRLPKGQQVLTSLPSSPQQVVSKRVPILPEQQSIGERIEKIGIEATIAAEMSKVTTASDRALVALHMVRVVVGIKDAANAAVHEIWEKYIVKESLWDSRGGEEAYKTEALYDIAVKPMLVNHSETVGRQERAMRAIRGVWGDDWEVMFDPEEDRLQRKYSEHFLSSLRKLAMDGWSMEQTAAAMDAEQRERVQHRGSGKRKQRFFQPGDALNAKIALTKLRLETVGAQGAISEISASEFHKIYPAAWKLVELKQQVEKMDSTRHRISKGNNSSKAGSVHQTRAFVDSGN